MQDSVLAIIGLERGEYQVQLTDGQGCSSSCSFSVSGPPCDLFLQVDEQAPTCFGSADGAIFTKVNTSRSPYQIDWNKDQFDNLDTLRNLPAGNYNVTVTDQIGCVVNADIELTQRDSITLICRQSAPISTVGGQDGKANILLIGGAKPYRLRWNGPLTDSLIVPQAANLTLEGLPAGEYKLVVTDANGCENSCFFSINEPACNLLLFLFEQTPVLCFGDATADINLGANNGRRPYSYAWSGPTPIGNVEDPTDLSSGKYTVTVTDAVGCSDSSSITITEPPPILINCAQIQHVSSPGASDGIAELRAEGGYPPYDFIWKGPSLGDKFTLIEDGKAQIDQLSPGHYEVTVTDEKDCVQYCSFEITIFSCELTIQFEKQDISCAGAKDGSARLIIENEQAPITIDWNVDSLDGRTSADNLSPGDYQVSITDALGCDSILQFNITEPPVLSLECGVTQEILTLGGREGLVSISAAGGVSPYQVQWNGPESGSQTIPTADTITLENLPAGSYTLLLTDANDCTKNCSFTLDQPGCNDFSIELTGSDLSCFGSNDGVIQLSVNDQPIGAPHAILWSIAGQERQTEIRGLSADSYTVTVTNAQLCTLSDTLRLNEPTALTLNCLAEKPAGINGAANGRALLTFAGGIGPYSLQWDGSSTGQQIAEDAGDIILNSLASGNYQLLITDAQGCNINCDLFIPQITCTLSLATEVGNVSCPGNADGFIEIFPQGNSGRVFADWSEDLYDGKLSIAGLASGSYQVQITDSLGCEVNIGFFIAEPLPLELSASGIPPGCTGGVDGAILFEMITGGNPPYRVGVNEGALIDVDHFPYTIESLPAGNYALRLTDQNGCELQQPLSILEAAPLVLELEEDKTIFRGQKTTIDVVTLNFDPATIRWNPQTGLDAPDRISTEAAPLETTTYTLSLTHPSGCTITDQIRVAIDHRRRAYVPNAFRPESTENTHFTVFGGSELQLINQMLLFDRWGNLVFKAVDFLPNDASQGWNGLFKGQEAPSAIYIYVIEVTFADGETEILQGDVMLVR